MDRQPDGRYRGPKRVDANNYDNVWKKGGKVTVTAKVSVSADGKTLTVTQAGVDPQQGRQLRRRLRHAGGRGSDKLRAAP